MAPFDPNQTIEEEAGLPEHWKAVDVAPINPGAPPAANPNTRGTYYSGAISPTMQHDATLVGSKYSGRTPQSALMPLPPAAQPSFNAATKSIIQNVFEETITNIGGLPGGNVGQLQFNNSGAFGGVNGSSVDSATGSISLFAQLPSATPFSLTGNPLQSVPTGIFNASSVAAPPSYAAFTFLGATIGQFLPTNTPALVNVQVENAGGIPFIVTRRGVNGSGGNPSAAFMNVTSAGHAEFVGGGSVGDGNGQFGVLDFGGGAVLLEASAGILQPRFSTSVLTLSGITVVKVSQLGQANANTFVPLTVMGAPSQSADLFDISDSTPTVLTGFNSSGVVSKYNSIATVSNGVPSEYAKIDLTAQAVNIGASTLYAVPASGAGMYRISVYIVETTAASLSSTLPNVQIVYTDNDTGVSITIDATPILAAAGLGQTGALTANTVGTAASGVTAINVQASTTIQYQTVNYTSSAAGMQYALHIKLEAL